MVQKGTPHCTKLEIDNKGSGMVPHLPSLNHLTAMRKQKGPLKTEQQREALEQFEWAHS